LAESRCVYCHLVQLKKAKVALATLEETITELIQERDSVKEGADAVAAELSQTNKDQVDRYRAEVAATQTQAELASAAVDELKQTQRETEAELTVVRRSLNSASIEERAAGNKVREVQAQLGRLQESQGNPVLRFGGPAAVKLQELVGAALGQRRFHRPPIGPIGNCLSLKDDRWGRAVQAALGVKFSDWIVHDAHDHAVLKGLVSQAGLKKTSYVVYNFDIAAYNLPPGSVPPRDVTTILDVLGFPDDALKARVLRNVLIDHNKVEKTVLVESEAEAKRMLRNKQFWYVTRGFVDGTASCVLNPTATSAVGKSTTSMGAGPPTLPTALCGAAARTSSLPEPSTRSWPRT
jgi:chromosome segregation ATPase